MAFSDNLTPEQAADCAEMGIDFDKDCADRLAVISRDASWKRRNALFEKMQTLPVESLQSISTKIDEELAKASPAVPETEAVIHADAPLE